MKLKTAYTIIFSFYALFACAQTIEETYHFANRQFETGNYQAALTEFQRVAFFDSGNQFPDIYQKIGDSFFSTGEYNSAVRSYGIASRIALNDSLKSEIILKKAMCHFKQENYFFALNDLLTLPPSKNNYLTNKISLFTAVAWFGVEDYEQALSEFKKIFSADSAHKLDDLFKQFEKTRKRFRPEKIETLSIIFPGLGQIYCGDLVNGINSIALVGSIAVVAIVIWQSYGLLDAFLSVSSWYYRYYTGGIKNAKATAIEKISVEKEKTYNEIIRLVEYTLSQQPQ